MADDDTIYKNGAAQQTFDLKTKNLELDNFINGNNSRNKIKQENDSFINGTNSRISVKQENSYSNYSSDDSSDSPLDFSVKRKSSDLEACGRESVPSSSSTGDTCSLVDERKSSESEDGTFCNGVYQNGDISDESKHDGLYGEPKAGSRENVPASIHGLADMMSALHSGLVPHTSLLSTVPSMATLVDPRLLQTNKPSRPFKAYPKDPLSMPLGSYGFPAGLNPLHGIDASVLRSLNLNSEELMNMYKHQISGLKRNESSLYKSTPRTTSSTHAPSTTTFNSPSSTTSNSNDDGNKYNGSIPSPSTRPSLSGVGMSTSLGRKRPRSLPDNQKDEAYWERRRKNNDAAKRSRDARRAKEDEIAIRAALLEQENLKLRVEVAALKTETAKLRCMLYNS